MGALVGTGVGLLAGWLARWVWERAAVLDAVDHGLPCPACGRLARSRAGVKVDADRVRRRRRRRVREMA